MSVSYITKPGCIVEDSGIYEMHWATLVPRHTYTRRATLVKGKRAPPGPKGFPGLLWIQVVDTNPND